MQESKKFSASGQFRKLDRRERLHQLVLALLHNHEIELMDGEAPQINSGSMKRAASDPAQWLDRNRRILLSYQAIVRSAVTLDAILDSEENANA